MPDTYQISVRSYEVMNAPVIGQAVHNEIVFLKNGEVICAFNGDPRNRETGEINFPSLSGKDTLRVRATPQSMKSFATEFPIVAEATLLETNDPEVIKHHLAQATDAADFINRQNMDYVIIGGPFHIAQNSNSVAHTLTTAMELSYPPEIENLWAPGHGRILLSEKWRAPSDGLRDENLVTHLETQLNKLDETKVGEKVKQDPNPYSDYSFYDDETKRPGILFDPKKAIQNQTLSDTKNVTPAPVPVPQV